MLEFRFIHDLIFVHSSSNWHESYKGTLIKQTGMGGIMTGIDQINLFKWLVGIKLEPNNSKILKISAGIETSRFQVKNT